MTNDQLTPETMKLNEIEPAGFTSEPRTISQEVARMRVQVTTLCDTVQKLVEVNQRLEAALLKQIQ